MRTLHLHLGLAALCGLFGRSRQAYYDHEKRLSERMMEHAIVLELGQGIREKLPRAGTPKLHFMLEAPFQQYGIKMGRNALNELLSDHEMLVRKKRRRARTTDSNHRYRMYENLTIGLEVVSSERLWVSDITYIPLEEGFSYLSLVTDAYSGMVLGHCLYETLASAGPIRALEMAISTRQHRTDCLIHHSDRGVQYCCDDYTGTLKEHGILISMTKNGDPYQNAKAERVNGILKDEFLLNKVFGTHQEALEATERAIEAYNHVRPHASCDFLTPAKAHGKTGPLKKRWKDYKRYGHEKIPG